jgi:exopolysaccharide production protein ExoQ
MSPQVATALCFAFILGLFWIARDKATRTSMALWIPVIWLSIASSRMVSQWLLMTPPSETSPLLDGSPLDRNILTSLLAAGLAVLLSRGRKTLELLRANWPILLFCSYCAASMLWSDFPQVAFRRWIKSLGDLIMVMVVLTEEDPNAAVKRLLARVTIVLFPLSILLIKYYGELGRTYSYGDWQPIFTGVTADKNMLGMICLLLGLATVWRLIGLLRSRPRKYRQVMAFLVILSMGLWLLKMARSSTALACFMLGVTTLLAMELFVRGQRVRVHLITSGLICVALLVALFPDLYTLAVESFGRKTNLTGRTELWALLLTMDANPILGTGFESFWLGDRLQRIWQVYWWHPNESHNGYLETYLNLGWVGLALLVNVICFGYKNIIASLRQSAETTGLRFAYLLVVPLYNFSEAAFRTFNPVWICFLLAVVAAPAPAKAKRLPVRPLVQPPVATMIEVKEAS